MAQIRLDDGSDPITNPIRLPTADQPPTSSAGPVASMPDTPTQRPTADQNPPLPSGVSVPPGYHRDATSGNILFDGYNPTTGAITGMPSLTVGMGPGTTGQYINPPTATAGTTGATGTGVQTKYGLLSAADKAQIDQMLGSAKSVDDPNYWYELAAQHGGVASTGADWLNGRIAIGDGALAVRNGTAKPFQETPSAGVFSDPATQPYEQLINSLVGKLQTPYQAPDYQPAIDQLKAYFQQLQGPAYSPQQLDLMQTQALDPQTTQRDAARQQIIQHFAALGQSPSSGTVQDALQKSDQKFQQLRTTTQAGFANNAIGIDKQQQAMAAQLGPQIAALETGLNTGNENRALQGVDLAGIIPRTAWQRLTGANSLIQPINTASLLGQQTQDQQLGYQNSANYTNGIIQLLMQLAGGA